MDVRTSSCAILRNIFVFINDIIQYKIHIMFSFQPTSRQERRSLYLQQYRSGQVVVHLGHCEFSERWPKLYRQILVDSRRALFSFFKSSEMRLYLSQL